MSNTYSKSFSISKNKSLKMSFIDINNKYDNYELNFYLDENASLNLDISVFVSKMNKQLLINAYHKNNSSVSKIYCNGIAKKGKISFNINSIIDKGTYDNNCVQEINGLLLSKDAKIFGNPNLLIDTNKIKASHKLSIGNINRDYLFYIMSKGISEKDAKILLSRTLYYKHFENINDPIREENINEKIKEFYSNE